MPRALLIAMYKQTLEILPLAILLTVIMSFGAKSAQFGAQSAIAKGRESSEYSISSSKIKEISDYLAGPIETRWSRVPLIETLPMDTDAETPTGDHSEIVEKTQPKLFIDRPPVNRSLPYFTSRDIAKRFPRLSGNRKGRFVGDEGDLAERSAVTSNRKGDDKIRLNSADGEALERIPGIGPSKAGMILSRRPANGFSNWEELLDVPGIGPSTLATIQIHAVLDRGVRKR